MKKEKKKILIVCRSNVNRSKMAVPIFKKISNSLGLDGRLEFQSAGIRQSYSPEHDYANIALQRAGYEKIDDDKSRSINLAVANWADVIFSMNPTINASLKRRYNSQEEIIRKINILPHYGLPESERRNDVFDPRYILVSPHDHLPVSDPISKKIAAMSLVLFPTHLTNWLVYRFTPYIPLVQSSHFREEITSLYTRSVKELEQCITGALERMKKEEVV